MKKILAAVKKDSRYENESQRTLVMLRCFYLVFLCYLLLFQLLMFFGEPRIFSWLGAVFTAAVCWALYCTYRLRVHSNLIYCSAVQLLWIVGSVYLYGWDVGVQHFIFVLLALVYFSLYETPAIKAVTTALLFALRLGMYFFCKTHVPQVLLPSSFLMIMQVFNSLFLFLQLGILFGTFSSNIESAEKKLVEYNTALSGISGIETSFALSYTALVKTGLMPLSELVRLYTSAPDSVVRLQGKGIREGAPAKLTVADCGRESVIDAASFVSKGKNTPFDGVKVYAGIVCTVYNGQIVYEA